MFPKRNPEIFSLNKKILFSAGGSGMVLSAAMKIA